MILFTFYRSLPHPFIWESKSGETARSLTQLVSVNRGHFHSVCVFYKLLVHCSPWEGGPAACDPSPGKKPAIYLISARAWPRPWELSPRLSLISSLAQFCITAHRVKPRYTPHGYMHVGLSEHTRTGHTHPHPPPGNLSPINNSLLSIRNICGTVKTFLLHLQRGWLLMLYRLWKPSRIKHYGNSVGWGRGRLEQSF